MALLALSGDLRTHDPTIVKENGVFYRFQTGEGLPFQKSTDFTHWEKTGSVFSEKPSWTSRAVEGSSLHFWAPEIVKRGDEWRIYYSVSTFGSQKSAIGLCVNKTLNPESPDYRWEDLGAVIVSDESCRFNAIDPCVISDEKGDYLLFGSFWGGLFIAPLTSGGFLAKDAEARNIATRNLSENAIEGGYIFKHGDYFYLFASFDFCCRGITSSYKIAYGRAKSLSADFCDKSGKSMKEGGGTILRSGDSFERWAGTGHCSVFADGERQFLVYHAYDRENSGESKLLIEEFFFDSDGWIVF